MKHDRERLIYPLEEVLTSSPHNRSEKGIHTRLAHGLTDPMQRHGFIHPPQFRGSTVLYPNVVAMSDGSQKYTYGTITPSTKILCDELTDLEGAAHTILTPNGLSAISLPLLAFLSAGDHVLVVDSCYFPTRRFCNNVLSRLGIEIEYYSPDIGTNIAKLMRPNTKVVFMEAPASNSFEMIDIPFVTQSAKQSSANSDVVVMMDNTWATPLYFRPLEHGVDVSIHALTKYPGGHSDLLLGGVSVNARCAEQLAKTANEMGMCVGADDVHLVLRGLKTMALRLKRHEESALEIAKWLKEKPQVARIMHPALPDDPGYDIWKRDFSGAGGLFAMSLKTHNLAQAIKFVEALEYFGIGYSWGGHESLVLIPNFSDRTIVKPAEGEIIIRLQIGLEDVSDLKKDIEQAFSAANL